MLSSKPFAALVIAVPLLVPAITVHAADARPPSRTPMKMDEPMPIKMAKPGTPKSDVKKAAMRKDQQMKPIMDSESAGMPKK